MEKLSIHDKLSLIQTKFKTKKTRFNSFGKYYFRSAEDILEAIKPYLQEYKVTVTVNEEFIPGDVPVIKSIATIADKFDNAIHTAAIVGVDLNQKGMQTAQQFGAASSYGKKYSLGNLFLIDDTADADTTNSHGKSNTVNKIKQAAKPVITKDQLAKAKEYMAAGGSIDAIESKYKLTNEQKANIKKTL